MSVDDAEMANVCDEYLMETQWEANGEEGFTCSLPAGHDGPHRAEGGINDVNVGTDDMGRTYTWVYEWKYQ